MSEVTRRSFLAAVPAAGLAASTSWSRTAAHGTASVPHQQSGPPLGSPVYLTRKRKEGEPGGLILKISGLTVTRISADKKTARTYFLDMERAGFEKHFAQLIIDKRGIVGGHGSPDAVTRNLAIYNVRDGCTIDGPAEPLKLTMGTIAAGCGGAGKHGLNSFLQPRASLGWKYTPASDADLEDRSVGWFDFSRGRFEEEADFKVGDPGDEPMQLRSGSLTGPIQVVRQVLYYGIPALEHIKFMMPGRSVTVDARTNQIIAGLVHLPLHEHVDVTPPVKLPDFAVLSQLMETPRPVDAVIAVDDCKAEQHLGCACCDPVVEIL